jgi:hypothetical protein
MALRAMDQLYIEQMARKNPLFLTGFIPPRTSLDYVLAERGGFEPL